MGASAHTITFANEVKRSDDAEDDTIRLPVRRTEEEHLAVLHRQRNPEDKGVLRIPGPRDQDRGMAPETVDEEESMGQMLRRESTFDPRRPSEIGSEVGGLNGDSHTISTVETAPHKRGITIEEPQRPSQIQDHVPEDARTAFNTLGALRLRTPRIFHADRTLHDDDNSLHPTRSMAMTFSNLRSALSRDKSNLDQMPYLSWEPTVGRNSAFVDLSEAQREELGGVEYRSLKSLALILVIYFWGFAIFGIICLTPWIKNNDFYGQIVEGDGQGRSWWGIFTGISAFTDLGFTLTPDSMISFQTAVWPLLSMSFLIIVGNTGFPVMLRFIIWVTSLYVPTGSGIWEELRFLLDHPRRCFTLLFPSGATWWLFWILVGLNGLDMLFFIVLDVSHCTLHPQNIPHKILAR